MLVLSCPVICSGVRFFRDLERRDGGLATVGLASPVVVQVGVPKEEDDKCLVGPGFMLADRIGDSVLWLLKNVLAAAEDLEEAVVRKVPVGRDETADAASADASLTGSHGHQLADLLVADLRRVGEQAHAVVVSTARVVVIHHFVPLLLLRLLALSMIE